MNRAAARVVQVTQAGTRGGRLCGTSRPVANNAVAPIANPVSEIATPISVPSGMKIEVPIKTSTGTVPTMEATACKTVLPVSPTARRRS